MIEANLARCLPLQLSLPHNIWSEHSLNGVQLACMRPGTLADSAAYGVSRCLSGFVHALSVVGWSKEQLWLRRLHLLSVVSGAPGQALAQSAPRSSRLRGDRWAQSLVAEAGRETERLALLERIRAQGRVGHALLAGVQATLGQGFLLAHLVSPRFCRWLGGYVEEELVKAYTQLLQDIDAGMLPAFAEAKAAESACKQLGLPGGSSMREVFNCMRAERMLSR